MDVPQHSNSPRVHVVIPAYNAVSTICRALASALEQSGAEISVCVVDNGSTDGTRRMVERWAGTPHLEVLHLERRPNQRKSASFPLAFALKHLLSRAGAHVSEWFLRLDADDLLATSTCVSDLLNAQGSKRLLFGRIVFFDSLYASTHTYTVAPRFRTLQALLEGAAYSTPHHAGLIRFDLLSQVLAKRGFLFDLNLGYGEDLDLTLALLRECTSDDFVFDDRDFCFKQLDGETVSLTTHPVQIGRDHLRIFRRHRLLRSHLAFRSAIDLSCQALGWQRSALRRCFGFPGKFWAQSRPVSNESIIERLAQLEEKCR